MAAIATCPPGFTVPFTGTMTPQDPTPVAIDNGDGWLPTYGWLVAGPINDVEAILGMTLIVMDAKKWRLCYPDAWQVTKTSGCECGNPWTLCHPEA